MQLASPIRDIVGFLLGGISGALSAGVVHEMLYPLPEVASPRDHTLEGLVIVVLTTFLAGGWIGSVGISVDFLSDFLAPILVPSLIIGFLGFVAQLDVSEILHFLGFSLVGMAASVLVSLLLYHRTEQGVGGKQNPR